MQFPIPCSGYIWMDSPSPRHKMHPAPVCWHFPNVPKYPLQMVDVLRLDGPGLEQRRCGACELRHLPYGSSSQPGIANPPHLGRPRFFPYSPLQQFQLPVNVSQPLRDFFQGFPFILILKLCAFITLKLSFSQFP